MKSYTSYAFPAPFPPRSQTHTPTHLGWKQRELVVSLESGEERVFVSDEVVGVVPVNGYPVTAPVDDEVMWEWPVVNSPHVVVTLHESSV